VSRFRREVRVLRAADVRASIDMASCIDACERAFADHSTGRAEDPAVIQLNIPERQGEVHVKAGHVHGAPAYAVKVASSFPRNGERGLPTSDGMIVAFDADTGAPVAFLLDDGYLTDLRTGAAGGVAARHLAPEHVWSVAVIGTGAQARHQLDALALERPGFTSVRVWGRNPERARDCVDELRARPGLPDGCRFEAAGSVQDAVSDADVVITCTASRSALVLGEWLKLGSHVTAVGSDGPDKQELDPAILGRADVLVVDSRRQCAAIGELHHAIAAGLATPDRAVELGEICADVRPGRTSAQQLTVCDLTGLGVQDVAAANLTIANAGDLGERIEL
jgi:ornithine cyclodeaminase/alanine dehydrogenase-like protein (mu-crystallin family)